MAGRKRKQITDAPLPLTRGQVVLALVACDRTFVLAHREADGHRWALWVGKCIHCRSALVVDPKRPSDGTATLEHIVPQSLQGQHRADNLALSCARCNHQKGSRLDPLGLHHPRLMALVEKLQQERRRRLRPPPEALQLTPAAKLWLDATS